MATSMPASTTPAKPYTVLDETGDGDNGGHLIRTYQLHPRPDRPMILCVNIRRDTYNDASYAYAEVFTPAMTWTRITEVHPSAWHQLTLGLPRSGNAVLLFLADHLAERALSLLQAAGL